MDDLRAGFDVTPNVRLLRPLAEGGMGRVWVAEHRVLMTEVVVKFLAKSLFDHADASARFIREASAIAAVKSPHVVTVFDSGVTEDGVPYHVMELLEGRDLGKHLEEVGTLSPDDVALLLAQLAKALGKAHRLGIVHRDVKPENVFLCNVEGGESSEIFVKLLDFGTAKGAPAAPTTTTTGQLLGTPYYMSPEQIVGDKDIDLRADVWSVGVVAFEALTGRRPFEGATVGALTLAIHSTIPKVTDAAPHLPAALDAWFATACARAPQDRFASVRDLAVAFAKAIDHRSARLMLDLEADAPSGRHEKLSPPPRTPARSVSALSATLAPRSTHRPGIWIGALGATALAVIGFGMMAKKGDGDVGTAASAEPKASVTAAATMSSPPAAPPPSAEPSASTHVTAAAHARPRRPEDHGHGPPPLPSFVPRDAGKAAAPPATATASAIPTATATASAIPTATATATAPPTVTAPTATTTAPPPPSIDLPSLP